MIPGAFIAKWCAGGASDALSERAGAQPHFHDLCDLLGVDKPADPENYCFERGAKKTGAGRGWADVWKRHHFAWEYKAPGGNLGEALKQLMTYALALDNPPLLVVSDRHLIHIHTHFTGTASEVHTIAIEDIGTPENLTKLKWLFKSPDKFRPDRTVREITTEAAGHFADIACSMTARGHDPHKVAHFLIQCLFCMFAEDVELLPEHLFQKIISKRGAEPGRLTKALDDLFGTMKSGGDFLLEDIPWFNGGLFEQIEVIEPTPDEISALLEAAKMNWRHIEPSIFGTLFERGLNPTMRSQLGANYTDPDTIMKLVQPVIIEPLMAEWAVLRTRIEAKLQSARASLEVAEAESKAELTSAMAAGSAQAFKAKQAALAKKREARKGVVTKAENESKADLLAFLNRLKTFRVLDPACGSGNFLYLALRSLKDIEHRVNLDAEAQGLHRELHIETCPANVLGIEINTYAAELARVTVWIGEIQWMLTNGYDIRRNPILASLNHIECRDALVNEDGAEASWPSSDVIVGNPPFLGSKRMRSELGDEATDKIRNCYGGLVPGEADLVAYWFGKALKQLQSEQCLRAGLVATNSIRQTTCRPVIQAIKDHGRIFNAWSDEPWVNEGAAVRVSLICFDSQHDEGVILDGEYVESINSDLTPGGNSGLDMTQAKELPENRDCSYFGFLLAGKFAIDGSLARTWLMKPNPNGMPNSDVLRPICNGNDILKAYKDRWVIDFGHDLPADDAALYAEPYAYLVNNVKAERLENNRPSRAKYWWRFGETRPGMRRAIAPLSRYIATVETSKHRVFVWLPKTVAPEHKLVVIARDDDATFGILSSRIHVAWVLAQGSTLEDRPVYTTSRCFETFPFPSGFEPNRPAPAEAENATAKAIGDAARVLVQQRENMLRPTLLVDRQPEVVDGYPDRIVPKPGKETEYLTLSLTRLYTEFPSWLKVAHIRLDMAVAAAYGWTDYTPEMADGELLRRLLALNSQRATLATESFASATAASFQEASEHQPA